MVHRMNPGARTLLSSLAMLWSTAAIHSVEMSSHIWTGSGADSNVITEENWDPDPGVPGGEGDENLVFGDIGPNAQHTVNIPDLGGPVAFNDLFFTGSGPLNYTFTGSSTQSALFLYGDVTMETAGSVVFANSLQLGLYYSGTDVTLASGATISVQGQIYGYEGGGYITQYGAGTLELSGQNTFGSGFSLREGTLRLGGSSLSEDHEILSGPTGTGTLKLYNHSTLTITSGGNFTLHNTVDLECNYGLVTVNVPDSSRLHLAGEIAGESTLQKTGAGELVLSNAHSEFSGGITVEGGRLVLGASSDSEGESIWGPFGRGTVSLLDGTTLGVLNASTSYDLHNEINLGGEGTGSVTIDVQTGSDLRLYGELNGGASLTKTGSGILTVNGYNSYLDGTITVNAGTFAVAPQSYVGASAVTVNNGGAVTLQGGILGSTVTVNNGGKLTGAGFVREAVIGAGGILSPGSTAGLSDRLANLTFEDLTLGKNSILEIDVRHLGNGTFNFDQLTVTSPATLTITADSADPLTLRLISLNSDGLPGDLAGGLQIGTTYSLAFLSYHSGIVGDLTLGQNLILDTSAFTANLPGADFGLVHDDNTFILTFTPVPEPSTYALMALGLGLVGLSVWRKRRA